MEKFQLKTLFFPSNLISFLRLPLAVLTILNPDSDLKYLFFGLLVFSDLIDGIVARAMNYSSKIGGIIDFACDKISGFIIFVALFSAAHMEFYYWIFFLFRDVVSSVGYAILEILGMGKKLNIKSRFIGKLVNVLQFSVLLLILMGEIDAAKFTLWIVFAAAILAVTDYTFYYYENYYHHTLFSRKK